MPVDKRERELLRNLEDAREHLHRIKTFFRIYFGTGIGTVLLVAFGNWLIPFYDDVSWLGITLISIWGTVTIFLAIGFAMAAGEGELNSPWQEVKDADRKYSDYLIDKADKDS